MGLCLLSIFSPGTDSGHLEESENHYPGLLVKSADYIGYRSEEPHRETVWWGGRCREVTWMTYRARRRETETSSARLPAQTSPLQPCHSCGCVWFHRNKGIFTKWCNSEWPFVHLKLPSCLSDAPPFTCNSRRYRQACRWGFSRYCLFHTHPQNVHKDESRTWRQHQSCSRMALSELLTDAS